MEEYKALMLNELIVKPIINNYAICSKCCPYLDRQLVGYSKCILFGEMLNVQNNDFCRTKKCKFIYGDNINGNKM